MNYFSSRLLGIAAIFGITGVAFGAFGAHFLKSRIPIESIEVLKTGVLYLFVHTSGILFQIILINLDQRSKLLKASAIFFVLGIFLFSGSLFLIATQSLTGLSPSYYGFVTPIGGLFFISGWILLFLYAVWKRQ